MSFGVLQALNRRTVRAPVNPMDKSTIVSICPLPINEYKPTLQPGRFQLPPGSYEKPSILTIGPSSWWREVNYDEPLLEIPVGSVVMAESVVRDYIQMIEVDMGDCVPGVFFVIGQHDVSSIIKNHKPLLDESKRKQDNWFRKLVKMADSLWARSNGNPLAIDNLMRLAAQSLDLKDKPWMKDFVVSDLSPCPACGTLRKSDFPICGNCNTVINKEQFEKLGLKRAV